MPLKPLLSCLFLLVSSALFSQGFQWWNDIHNWDGVTPWHRYMILSPSYMGPNALPVPRFQNGRLRKDAHLQAAYERHMSEGDLTNNLFTRVYIPLKGERAALSLSMVPIEHYSMDTRTRDLRRARDRDGEGTSTGDLYIGTLLQLVKDRKYLPDLMLTLNIRTASGNNLGAARFTDTPGYFFDLSAGKSFRTKGAWIDEIRPHASFGFYAWQTFRLDYYQNDALMYSAGCEIELPYVMLSASWGGYSGYIGEGDNPQVVRLGLRSLFEGPINLNVRLQEGLRDFPYTSLRAGVEVRLWKKD